MISCYVSVLSKILTVVSFILKCSKFTRQYTKYIDLLPHNLFYSWRELICFATNVYHPTLLVNANLRILVWDSFVHFAVLTFQVTEILYKHIHGWSFFHWIPYYRKWLISQMKYIVNFAQEKTKRNKQRTFVSHARGIYVNHAQRIIREIWHLETILFSQLSNLNRCKLFLK